MKELMMNEDFSDVTLITEDKKEIKANINILTASSPFFKDILKKEKNSKTIMYLIGVFNFLKWIQSCNLFILGKQHSMRREWMNFLL